MPESNKEELLLKVKKKRTRLWSLLLVLMMVIGMLPTTALAEEPDAAQQFVDAPGEIFYRNDGNNDSNGPTEDTIFTLTEPTMITGIWTYHWNAGNYEINFSQQTIQLKDTNTNTVVYSGVVRVGHIWNTRNCDWIVLPNIVLPAGTYQLIDSHHESWSALNGKGVCMVKGYSTTPSATAVSSVAITGVDAPVSNTTLDTAAVCETTGVSSTTPSVTWNPSGSKAEYGKIYTADITLSASEGYKFADGVTATVNGNPATNVMRNTDGTLTVTYEFPKTEKHNIELTFNTAVRDGDPVRNPTINSGYKIPLCIFVEDTNKNGDFTDDKTVLLDKALVEEFIAQPEVTMTYEEFMATFKSELGIDEIKTEYTGGYNYSVFAIIEHSEEIPFAIDANKKVTDAIVKVNGKEITNECKGGSSISINPGSYVFTATEDIPQKSQTPAVVVNTITYNGEVITANAEGEYVSKKAKKPKISKLQKGKKSFKNTWKKVKGVSGYQVQYSTSKNFTNQTSKKATYNGNKKFTKTVKKLKGGKKYYVRIRTYKNVKINGKTVRIYSSWSSAKAVKTRK